MPTVDMLDAKTHLSHLVESVEGGAEAAIVIARNGKPAARLVPIAAKPDVSKRLGLLQGKYCLLKNSIRSTKRSPSFSTAKNEAATRHSYRGMGAGSDRGADARGTGLNRRRRENQVFVRLSGKSVASLADQHHHAGRDRRRQHLDFGRRARILRDRHGLIAKAIVAGAARELARLRAGVVAHAGGVKQVDRGRARTVANAAVIAVYKQRAAPQRLDVVLHRRSDIASSEVARRSVDHLLGCPLGWRRRCGGRARHFRIAGHADALRDGLARSNGEKCEGKDCSTQSWLRTARNRVRRQDA